MRPLIQTHLCNLRLILVLLAALLGLESSAQTSRPTPITNGFVFIDGRYLPPPYKIKRAGESLSINGEQYSAAYFGLTKDVADAPIVGKAERVKDGQLNRRRAKGAHKTSDLRERANRVQGRKRELPSSTRLTRISNELQQLHSGVVIILYSENPPLLLEGTREGQDLLKVLIANKPNTDINLASMPLDASPGMTQRLVSEFRPTPEFLHRAKAFVASNEAVQTTNTTTAAANLRVDRFGYPLTIFAMVIVVLAFGHLLSNKPCTDLEGQDPKVVAISRDTMIRSLVLVGLLSAVDLAWTLLANQAGSMREMNPLGSQMISNPIVLILFKSSVTGLSIGLLYWLHRQPLAQAASWWCCLVLTLLTARWLTFDSMFL